MTYCQGKPLHLFDKEDPVYKKAYLLFSSSCLHTFFTYHIIHGDIHTGNILVREDGTISIIDFGICIKLSIEQEVGIFSIVKFQQDPTVEHCFDVIDALIHPFSIHKKKLDLDSMAYVIYERYMEKHHLSNRSISDFFNIITEYIQQYNVLLRGNILSYFFNIMLLEGLSPLYGKENRVINIYTIHYMKQQEFFMKECGKKIWSYYDILKNKIPKELLQEYNIN
jgi:predicted unusual protein kinase regulating ubiquinone biosynthesis (AarF/ABC1/UbiB family)